MELDMRTMKDFDFNGKRVLVRCDFNSPLDADKNPLEFMRIKAHAPTFLALKDAGKIVVLSHQARKGEPDCVSLRKHSEVLGQAISKFKQKVVFCDDTIGEKALAAIDNLKKGEVLVLENTRFLDEDNKNNTPENNKNSRLVQALAPKFDIFVNDAFSVSHRSQPSVTGFALALPSCAGPLVEKEMIAMHEVVHSARKPRIYLLGGKKLDEVVKLVEATLKQGSVDKFLIGGASANAFLAAKGEISFSSCDAISEKGEELNGLLERIKKLEAENPDKFVFPVDRAIAFSGREEVKNSDKRLATYSPLDLGPKTIKIFSREIRKAGSIISKGPMGKYEDAAFSRGTIRILLAMEKSKAYTLIGGGHMGSLAADLGIKVDHISTAGGAVLAFMSGEKLPGIEVLKNG